MNFTGSLKEAIRIAQALAKEYSNAEFTPAHLLKALLHKNVGLNQTLMDLEQDLFYLEEWADVRIESCPKTGNIPENPAGNSEVQAVFREAENIRLKLSRDETDPECVLVALSTPGVGKTALVNGFAQNVVEEKVPAGLAGAIIFELDYGSLIAGASYKGEVEDRLKKIIGEIRQFDKAILFIDEIHILLDKQGGASGAANLLKPELARGNLTIIGTTSIDNYTKFIETDEAFNRQFERILL